MKITFYPSLNEVLHLHRELIRRFGGRGGVRDLGLLESALMRPQTGYYDSLVEQAGALMQSLCQNHAFVDGNKRVAFAVTAIFLRCNGLKLVVDAAAGEDFLVNRVIKARAPLEEISGWITSHAQPV